MNWIIGEYGENLRITMPFSAVGSTVTIKVRRPQEQTWVEWTADLIEADGIEHTIVDGDLAKVGVYRGVVEVADATQLRKALFSFTVNGLTGSDIEGSTV